MKHLENIPKKEIFEVPEGYFDRLPQVIQSRTSARTWQPFLMISLKYALPVVLLGLLLILWLTPAKKQSVEMLLADVQTEELIRYLAETDVELDDILLNTDLEDMAAEGVEEEVFSLFQDDYYADENIIDIMNQL